MKHQKIQPQSNGKRKDRDFNISGDEGSGTRNQTQKGQNLVEHSITNYSD